MTTKTIVFVDARVSHYASLIDGLADTAEVFVLDGESDGLGQMAAWLAGRSGVGAIHVISHGSQGALVLGSTVLDGGNLAAYRTQLADIGAALNAGGDILLYGCNVAAGTEGAAFVAALAQATGADVAASDDATGAAALGGDWVLEQGIGSVEVASLPVNDLAGLLAVNTAPSFVVSDGKLTTDFGQAYSNSSITLQPDGKILVARSNGDYPNSNFALARYNVNGSLDTGFDGDGKLTTDFFGSNDLVIGITLQLDGKILMVGSADDGGGNVDLALARYNANGSLDTSFDRDGKVTTDFFGSTDYGSSITFQTDGKILVATGTSGGYGLELFRYNADGSLDASFGTDSKLRPAVQWANNFALQADNKILVSGGYYNFELARYTTIGILDTSFSTDGSVVTEFDPYPSRAMGSSVALQSDGKILVAGHATNSSGYNDFALARYNVNGSLDTGFDGDGKLTTDFFGSNDLVIGITLQLDGKILMVGSADDGRGNVDFALARYNANGSLDTSFDGDGKVMINIGKNGGTVGLAYDVIVQDDGKIVVTGFSGSDFALARLNADGSLDTSFSLPENTLDNLPALTEPQHPQYPWSINNAVTLDPDVQILDTELASTGNYNGSTLTLQRHGTASPQDVFSAASSALTILTTGSYFAVDSVTIGRVTSNSAGTLILSFNANATQSLVNKAIQQIAYANSSDAPPASVQIDWTFNDGNTGAQGTGGAMSMTGSTTVQITATNDAPVLNHSLVDQSLSANTPFSYTFPADAFTDPDQETLGYSIRMNDGTGTPPWLSFTPATRTFSGTPGVSDAGELDIVVTATDSANATASYTVRLSVSATPVADSIAPTVTTFSPADEATGVAVSGNILVTFSEVVQHGTGNIVLKTAAGATVATYDAATSTNLSIEVNPVIAIYPAPPATSTLTINPSNDLAAGTTYLVEFAAGSIQDLAGNPYAGSTDYNFTTAATTPVVVLTGSNLLVAIQASTGVTLNAVLQAVTTAKLQQLFDNGTYSALSASIAIQAFSTEIKAMVDANGGTGAFVAHVSAVVAAIGANTDVPGFGTSLPFGATTATISADSSSSYNFTTAVNVLGADKFSYEAGGNSTAGINQTDISYASFVANILGLTMPTGSAIAPGGVLVVGDVALPPSPTLVAVTLMGVADPALANE